MASNLSQITEAVNNLNLTYEDIEPTQILQNAIQHSNDSTGGWIGIVILSLFLIGVAMYIIFNQNRFQIQNGLNMALVISGIGVDLGLMLLVFGILDSIAVFIFILTICFMLSISSFLIKELYSPDQ